ncbi:MAG TPA: methyltransferase domain-containing protein, partial [Candidatus Nitrosotalea sp.]|nr:methyltransferase domain-containing protein [Candidatus Nitrosotalea sp.]
DNCEHVINGAAEVASEILRKCPKVHVLCTSREALRVASERIYRMPSLPNAQTVSALDANTAMAFGSIALFVDRAQSAQPDFRLTDANVATVAAICSRLDGIALAIELVAARVGSVPLGTLAERVEHRMLALMRGSRDAAPRQQTMRSMIDWSYLLLSEEERTAFANLSVFAGGFTLEAGARLCCQSQPALDEFEAFELITALVDKSLLVLETRSEASRYRLLEPIREFAREKLIAAGEFDRIAALHALYFRNMIESIDRGYWQRDEQPYDPSVELANLRAALQWALADEHDVVTGAATAAALMGFWFVVGDEGRRWADLARIRLPAGTEPEIEARLNLGIVQLELGSPPEMRAAAESAVTYYREHNNAPKLAESLYFASMTIALYFPEERELAELLATEAIDVAKSVNAKSTLVLALRAKAVAMDPKDDDGRIAVMSRGLDLAREQAANPRLTTSLLMQLSELEFGRARYDVAIAYGLEALRDSERAGYTRALTFVRANLAHYAVMLGDAKRAHAWALEALKPALEAHDAYSATIALNALAAVEGIEGNAATAAKLFGFCNARFGQLHPPRQDRSCEEAVYRFVYDKLAESLGEERLAGLLKNGASITLEQALLALHQRQGSEFLREWHARYPGMASVAFWYGRIEGDGRSSYALLADDVAATAHTGTVVDLACGDGYLLELLAERLPGATLIGVDASPEELRLARERLPGENVKLVNARAEALPLADASVDAVVCHMALMLFDEARPVIAEMARVIRPGGTFAAVLGPAPGNSELLKRFGGFLNDARVAESLPALHAGDPATFAEDSLRALFDGDAWRDVRIEDLRVLFDGPDERVQKTLLLMYDVARLSAEGQAELARRLAAEMTERRSAGESVECVLGMRHLVARRA